MNIFEANPESFYQGMIENYIESNGEDREISLKHIDNIIFDGIDPKDYPDFPDCYVVSTDMYGHPMSDGELNTLNDRFGDWIYEKVIESI